MNRRVSTLLVVLVGCLGLAGWRIGWATPAVADDAAMFTAYFTTSSIALGEGEYTYVGSKKCKKCHIAEHKSWAKTKMGQALETLKPGQASEAKEKHGLDSAKDYSQDESCLKCHATGFGAPGGYAVPDPEDNKAVREAEALAGVGCESCHGPGSAYIEIFEQIQKKEGKYEATEGKYNLEELYAVGLQKIEAAVCTDCHNDQSPTHDPASPFDFEKDKDTDTHEHQELKLRQG